MDTKNEDAAKNTGAENTAARADTKNQKVDTKMDINRYLLKADHGKSIADMLRVLFKGQMATETEWAAKVQAVITRRAE
jgi:hypothetical protein